MTMTRTLCPLDCGWHHDQDRSQLPTGVTVNVTATMTANDIRNATVEAMGMRQLQDAEGAIRAHLETHELIEWVKALQGAKGERDLYRKEVDVSHQESQKLREMLGREYEAKQDAEAQVARVRAFLEDMAGWCSPHGVAADYSQRALDALDGVDPLGLAGPTREEQEADSYAAKVNAPLRPETIAALRSRLASGDYPIRKVKLRVPAACPPACSEGHTYDGGCLQDPQKFPDETGALAVDRGKLQPWAWRCWGTDTCDGGLSLSHGSAAEARRSYDRHCKREHGVAAPATQASEAPPH